MSQTRQTVTFVVCLLLVLVGVLSLVGATNRSAWDTFVPDLIIGVITAGGIAALVALVQVQSDVRRSHADQVTRAYENLLDVLGEMQLMDIGRRDNVQLLSKFGVRLINLAELVDGKEPYIINWFEAERQFGRYRLVESAALAADAAVSVGADPLDIELAVAPFRQWVNENVNNLRAWRNGMADPARLLKHAEDVERLLRDRGEWLDQPMPWRSGSSTSSVPTTTEATP